ncbi:MAG: LytTR family DNA-binding domain-containing protein [Gemmatimonadaceae bacterium]|jgi:two-component system LytT family response regulator|nr:LytTR family DNA-binding domain-containing protein [Gemmatimonadaceae bacterium]
MITAEVERPASDQVGAITEGAEPAARVIRCLLVDDEEAALRRLRRLLTADPRVVIAGEAADGASALARLEQGDVDVLFLDIQMPGMTGLEVARRLPADSRVRVVFVTAHDEYAINAFELSALDYLLKPVNPERLAATVRRLADPLDRPRGIGALPAALEAAGAPAPLQRVLVPDGKGQRLVDMTQVHLISAYGNYVKLHAGTDTLLYRQTMQRMEGALDRQDFVRIHRGAIVNVRFIASVAPYVAGDHIVTLKGGARVRLSRHYRDAFFDRFSPTT